MVILFSFCLGAFALYVFSKNYFILQNPLLPEKMTRLVSTGNCLLATLSPDGKYVAYVIKDAGRQSLRLMQVATSVETQIAPLAEVDYLGMTFSPDGNYLYYVANDFTSGKTDEQNSALYQVATIGGAPRKVTERLNSAITFSPDEKQFAFVREYTSEGVSALMVSNADGTGERRLAERKLPYYFDYPAWSPDGDVIGCVATGFTGPVHLNFYDKRGRKVNSDAASHTWKHVRKVQWLKEGNGIVLSVGDPDRESVQLWYLSYPGGEANRITNNLNDYLDVSLTPNSDALVTIESQQITSIWTWFKSKTSQAPQLVQAAGNYERVTSSQDGGIVYTVKTGAVRNIWKMKADGREQRQLTMTDYDSFRPSASPSGRYIVFLRERRGKGSIWKIDTDGSNQKALTGEISPETPQCSPDDKWVVFTAPSPKKWSVLWRVSLEGGAVTQLNDTISTQPSISPDGKLIACFYLGQQTDTQTKRMSIAILPFEGGAPLKIFEVPATVNQSAGIHWTADGRSLTYVDGRSGHSNIWSQSMDGGSPKPMTHFKGDQIFSFDWSRDGKQLIFLNGTVMSNVVLMSGFRSP